MGSGEARDYHPLSRSRESPVTSPSLTAPCQARSRIRVATIHILLDYIRRRGSRVSYDA